MSDSESFVWISDKSLVRERVVAEQARDRKVGLVPTMGNLHEGHASLFRQAAAETDFVVATIFVNPIQFGAGEDFDSYPRTPQEDEALCRRSGVKLVFAPSAADMYPPESTTRVQVVETEKPLCGRDRPGHFVGVATVLTKLFHLIPADIAYFGLKDYQQCKVIERMVADLEFPIEVRTCPIVREPDGLAMSSRNRYLNPEERRQATALKRSLDRAADMVAGGERDARRLTATIREVLDEATSGRVDYVELVDAENLAAVERVERPVVAAVAVKFGRARLIDNRVITP